MFTDEEIEAKVQELLVRTGLGNRFPFPIELIVEQLGFTCHPYIPDKDIQDIASAVSHSKKKIYINQKNSPQQQLFSIAHKVGHIILHGDNNDYIDSPKVSQNIQVQEAEYFATVLLMPKITFAEQWQQSNQNINAIALFFGVSEERVKMRAARLRLI